MRETEKNCHRYLAARFESNEENWAIRTAPGSQSQRVLEVGRGHDTTAGGLALCGARIIGDDPSEGRPGARDSLSNRRTHNNSIRLYTIATTEISLANRQLLDIGVAYVNDTLLLGPCPPH